MKKIVSWFLAAVMVFSLTACGSKQNEKVVADSVEKTGAFLLDHVTEPTFGSVGGEWTILGLARSDLEVSGEYYETYFENLASYTAHQSGVLHEKKYTEYSRVILAVTEVEFTGGASVFDVFRKILRQEKIHFEYIDATAYDSVYIEGIGNLYEYDCGPQSGWMYSVNGIYPGLGCSAYTLADGDVIVFSYTCDLGADLGAEKFYE